MHHGMVYVQGITDASDTRFGHLISALYGVVRGTIHALKDRKEKVNPNDTIDALEMETEVPYFIMQYPQLETEEAVNVFIVVGDNAYITAADKEIEQTAITYDLDLILSQPSGFNELIAMLKIGDPKTQKLNLYVYTSSPLLEAHVEGEIKRVPIKDYL